MPHLSRIDYVCLAIDHGLRTLFQLPTTALRDNPAAGKDEADLSAQEQQHVSALMRVNHAGEVCAQALYLGQAITARNTTIRESLYRSALEESDHLAWCQQRLDALNNHTSYLNPVWYLGSLGIGIMVGLTGDRWNLGFLAETEEQVSAHLERHLQQLPKADEKSRAIVAQMQKDEQEHADTAYRLGAASLPLPARFVMKMASRVMTTLAHRI